MSPPLVAQYRASFSTGNSRTHGFTLIEVLVTLLVLSVGLLGLAALQIQGLRGTHVALLHTQAAALAVDMAEHLLARTAATGPPDTQTLHDWKTRLAQRLPAGDGSVTIAAASITVQVTWNEHGAGRRYALSFTP